MQNIYIYPDLDRIRRLTHGNWCLIRIVPEGVDVPSTLLAIQDALVDQIFEDGESADLQMKSEGRRIYIRKRSIDDTDPRH